MRKQPRKLNLNRETLRHLTGGAGTWTIIDVLLTKPRSECPETCSIDPPSICVPEACSLQSCPDICPKPVDGVGIAA